MYKQILFTVVLFVALPINAKAEDLLTIFQLAQSNDSILQAKKAEQLAALEGKPQAQASFLPTINATANNSSYKQRATNGNTLSSSETGSLSPIGPSENHYNQSTYGLNLTQPIFYYQEWLKYAQANENAKEANATYAAAEQDLIVRTAQSYFEVLKAVDALKYSRAQRKAFAKFLEQTQQRFKVGLIAITDVEIAKAQHDNAYAQEIAAENELANKKEGLREIVGKPVEKLAFLRENLTLKSPEPADSEQWVLTALEQNFSLQAGRFKTQAARTEIKIKQAGHLPTLNIQSNLTHQSSTPIGSSTANANVSLNVSLPLFSGGSVHSKTKQAVYQYEQYQKEMETQYRKVESSTRQTYRNVLTQINQVNALKQAIISNTSALKATDAAFNVGTRTIVDVLKAQSDLIQAEKDYAYARYEYILQSVKLKQAAGILSPEDVRHINSWLTDLPNKPTPSDKSIILD